MRRQQASFLAESALETVTPSSATTRMRTKRLTVTPAGAGEELSTTSHNIAKQEDSGSWCSDPTCTPGDKLKWDDLEYAGTVLASTQADITSQAEMEESNLYWETVRIRVQSRISLEQMDEEMKRTMYIFVKYDPPKNTASDRVIFEDIPSPFSTLSGIWGDHNMGGTIWHQVHARYENPRTRRWVSCGRSVLRQD